MGVLSSRLKVTLSLRGLSIVLLFASVILLITSDNAISDHQGRRLFGYKAFSSYKYMLGTGVIGIAYSFSQIISFAIFRILMKNDSDVYSVIEFYGDKVVSYILATGSAAGFGATIDLKTKVKWAVFDSTGTKVTSVIDMGSFFVMIYGSAVLLFLAFLCTAILSFLSSYALPKKV